jgi:prolyl-tRNA synthetase
VKFKDADLIGVPFRITVGKKLSAGLVELVERRTKQSADVPVADAARTINPGTDPTFPEFLGH